MDMPEHSRVQPGARTLLFMEWGPHIPADVAEPLLALGRTCNDIGHALASARIEQARALDQQQRAQQRQDRSGSIEFRAAEALWEAAQGYIDDLVDLYASTAARYVAAAVEVASQAINQQPLALSAPLDVPVADILLLADIHVPLIQLDPTAFDDPKKRRRAELENDDIAESHRLLLHVMAETTKPANLPERRGPVRSFLVEPELAAALHEYACSCLVALYLATNRDLPA